jgi:hypothetical protein
MKRMLMTAAMICLALAVAGGQGKSTKKEPSKEMTITGRIIDLKCELSGMAEEMGEDHAQCAVECIKNGLPVGIREEKTENLYLVVPGKGMKPANEELARYADQNVKMTGKLHERGGIKMFAYTKVEAVK